MALSKIPSAGISNAVNFRNLIINGDMSIAQRSTSSETVTGAGGLYYHTVDRFGMNIHSDFNNKSTMAQNLDSLTAPDYFDDYVGLQIDTATTPSGDVYYNFRQQIEGSNIGQLKFGTSSAKTITISFWVRSTLTGNFSFSLRNANSDRSFVTTYNIATANTWEKKTITITGDTTGTWTSTNAVGLTANWGLGNSTGTFSTSTLNSWQGANKTGATSGVDLVATANAKWYITGIQVEAETSASEFEFLPVDVNLQRCMRYFQKFVDMSTLGCRTSTEIEGTFNFLIPMRASPSATQSGVKGFYDLYGNNSSQSSASIGFAVGSVDDTGCFLQFNNMSGLTQGRVMNPVSGTSQFSAEL